VKKTFHEVFDFWEYYQLFIIINIRLFHFVASVKLCSN